MPRRQLAQRVAAAVADVLVDRFAVEDVQPVVRVRVEHLVDVAGHRRVRPVGHREEVGEEPLALAASVLTHQLRVVGPHLERKEDEGG